MDIEGRRNGIFAGLSEVPAIAVAPAPADSHAVSMARASPVGEPRCQAEHGGTRSGQAPQDGG
jgi:hypothetical protein